MSTLRPSLDWSVPSIEVTDLVPGEVRTVTVTVTNDNPVPVTIIAASETSGELFVGEHEVVLGVDVDPEIACPTNPEVIGAGERVTVAIAIEVPEVAGNEYQETVGTATIRLTAVETAPCPVSKPVGPGVGTVTRTGTGIGGPLSTTGLDGLSILTVVVALLACGVILIHRARTKKARS